MFKNICCWFCILVSLSLPAQRGDELLVYSVKGDVTCFYNKEESRVKIGKVLYPEAVIKTAKGSSLTMVCSKGKPLSVEREGVYPASRWKDSCKTTDNSLSSNYFKYIWGQLLSYSRENKEAGKKRAEIAVDRGEPLPPGKLKKIPALHFSKGMDTVVFTGLNFPLSWNGADYIKNKYVFSLFDIETGRLLFRDSIRKNFIPIDSFKQLLLPGKYYGWKVTVPGNITSKQRVLYVEEKASAAISSLFQPADFPEDSAAFNFRIAYLLEKKHYLAEAWMWYQKAAAAAPEVLLFRDQVIRFRNEFWIR